MKLVICCTRAKPYLIQGAAKPMHTLDANNPFNFNWKLVNKDFYNDRLNGKIVVECDFEVEKIFYGETNENRFLYPEPYIPYDYHTNRLTETQLCYKSKLDINTLNEYLKWKNGYAIHIKNLHIFDKPKELFDYSRIIETPYGEEPDEDIKKISKTMIQCCYLENDIWKKAFMLPRTSEELCKILNGEQTTIILKRIPEEIETKI